MALLIGIFASAQELVPFRKGDKFGIADENGKMKIEPQFNYAYFGPTPDLLVGVNFTDGDDLKTLIHKGKIIISKSDYYKFSMEGPYVVAVKFFPTEPHQPDQNKMDIFDLNGKRLLGKSFSSFSYLNLKENLIGSHLVAVKDESGYSVLQVDSQNGKVIKKLFDGAERFYNDSYAMPEKMVLVYEKNQMKNQVDIFLTNGKISRISNSKLGAVPPKSLLSPMNSVPFGKSNYNAAQQIWKTVQLDYPSKSLKIKIVESEKSIANYEVKEKEKKMGIWSHQRKSWLAMPAYDEIYFWENTGHFIGKKGVNYSVIIDPFAYPFTNIASKTTEFPMLPLLLPSSRKDILHLFDKNGDFFCYANVNGSVYFEK